MSEYEGDGPDPHAENDYESIELLTAEENLRRLRGLPRRRRAQHNGAQRRKVTTADEAIEVLNRLGYRGFSDWQSGSFRQGEAQEVYSDKMPLEAPGGALLMNEAITIATALSGYTESLEAELESLRQERDTLREAAHKLVAAIPPWRFGQGLIAEKRDALIAALAQQPEVKER